MAEQENNEVPAWIKIISQLLEKDKNSDTKPAFAVDKKPAASVTKPD